MSISDKRSIISQIKTEIDDIFNKDISEFAKITAEEVRLNNPVDTGWSKANWNVTTGAPHDGTIPGNRNDYIDGGSPSDSEYIASLNNLKGYDYKKTGDIYITNNTDYIAAVNAGYTNGKHLAFVETSIDKAISKKESI